MTIAIGIDIGLSGALAAVDSRGTCQVEDLPIVDGRIHGRRFLDLLRRYVPPGEGAIVVLEDVHARPQTNRGERGCTMHSQGSLMRSRGICEAVLDIAGRMEVRWVQPQTWKRFYALRFPKGTKDSARKAASLDKARLLYPSIADSSLRLAKHHNRGEALLMAHYALVRLGDGQAPEVRRVRPPAGPQRQLALEAARG